MSKHLMFDVLSRMAERNLPPLEDARASRHLARCGRCRSELGWLERIRARPPHFGEFGSASDMFGIHRRPPGRSAEPARTDLDQGAWRINRAWLTGSNERSSPGRQPTVG
jgi:hypothetical protein